MGYLKMHWMDERKRHAIDIRLYLFYDINGIIYHGGISLSLGRNFRLHSSRVSRNSPGWGITTHKALGSLVYHLDLFNRAIHRVYGRSGTDHES